MDDNAFHITSIMSMKEISHEILIVLDVNESINVHHHDGVECSTMLSNKYYNTCNPNRSRKE